MTDPYSTKVREYFLQPRHVGEVAGGVSGYFVDQGLRIRLSAETADSRILRMQFQAWGCPHVIAAAEAACRRYEGASWSELESFNTAQIMADLGIPVEKTGRILVLEDTVRSLARAIHDRLQHD